MGQLVVVAIVACVLFFLMRKLRGKGKKAAAGLPAAASAGNGPIFGIIAAEESEIGELRDSSGFALVRESFGMPFHKGSIGGRSVFVVKCGMGKVNAALAAAVLVEGFGVTHLVNVGTAGAMRRDLPKQCMVVGTEAVHCDVDVTALGCKPGELPGSGTIFYPCDEQLRKVAAQACAQALPEISVVEGRVLTEDSFSTDPDTLALYKKRFGGDCIEMEGAAVAQAAWQHKIPCAIVRFVCNEAGSKGADEYVASRYAASTILARVIRAMIPLA